VQPVEDLMRKLLREVDETFDRLDKIR